MSAYDFIPIDINSNEELSIPAGYDLVVREKGTGSANAYVLYGFDEIGMFDDDFIIPEYGFLKS